MNRYESILGCLLGTAVGDAVGLRSEGLSRRRAETLYGGPPFVPSLFLGRGFCSDDTEHTQMVGRALALSVGDVGRFESELASQLKWWILAIPAGVGWATLRACFKLLIGFGPQRSGVFSAGNGPAMRSALIGVCAESDSHLKSLIRSSTRLTHTDPIAEEGALLVARAARLTAHESGVEPIEFLDRASRQIEGDELRSCLENAVTALRDAKSPLDYADAQGWSKGVSGYVNQTVPAALYCWASSPADFRRSVENAVRLGGDTDTVAAITGAVSGANLGSEKIPAEWIERMAEWPRTIDWMTRLAQRLTEATEGGTCRRPPSMHWPATVPRNVLFATIVLGLGFRRLLPPY